MRPLWRISILRAALPLRIQALFYLYNQSKPLILLNATFIDKISPLFAFGTCSHFQCELMHAKIMLFRVLNVHPTPPYVNRSFFACKHAVPYRWAHRTPTKNYKPKHFPVPSTTKTKVKCSRVRPPSPHYLPRLLLCRRPCRARRRTYSCAFFKEEERAQTERGPPTVPSDHSSFRRRR